MTSTHDPMDMRSNTSGSRDIPRPISSKKMYANSTSSSSSSTTLQTLPLYNKSIPIPIPTPTPTINSTQQPIHPPTESENRNRKIIIMLKVQLLVFFLGAFTLFVKLGRTTVISIPVARLAHPAYEAMATFFPDSSGTEELGAVEVEPVRVKTEKEIEEEVKRRLEDLERLEMNMEMEKEMKRERSIVEDIGFDIQVKEYGEEDKEEGKMYTQLTLVNVTEEKRGLMNWVLQMEYAGQTFFDGYVGSSS